MKKRLLTVLLSAMAAYTAQTAFAEKEFDVRFTVHNLSNNTNPATGLTAAQRQYVARTAGADQVCIFCHTPHNASPAVPLWNKVYDPATASTYRLYTSSKSLSSTVRNSSSISPTSESMLCLSCHDGKTAVNVLHNSRVREDTDGNGDAIIDFGILGVLGSMSPQHMGDLWVGTTSTYPSNLGAVRDANGKIPSSEAALNGTNLTDDHPIGFSYDGALAEKPNDLHSLADAKNKGLRFFGPDHRVECSSCHNPHVYYGYGLNGAGRVAIPGATQPYKDRAPFLVTHNNGSNLCLGCHIK